MSYAQWLITQAITDQSMKITAYPAREATDEGTAEPAQEQRALVQQEAAVVPAQQSTEPMIVNG